jgi:hypothetical protein
MLPPRVAADDPVEITAAHVDRLSPARSPALSNSTDAERNSDSLERREPRTLPTDPRTSPYTLARGCGDGSRPRSVVARTSDRASPRPRAISAKRSRNPSSTVPPTWLTFHRPLPRIGRRIRRAAQRSPDSRWEGDRVALHEPR